jgi:hypothetical protein
MYFVNIPVKPICNNNTRFNHVGRGDGQAIYCPQHCDVCDTCGNKLTMGIICALFYRRFNQFHYIIKRCLFHKKGVACVIQLLY